MELRRVLDELKKIEKTNENTDGALSNLRNLETPIKEGDLDDTLDELLQEAEDHLREAIMVLKRLEKVGREVRPIGGGSFSGQLRAYIIPHLESWIESERQPGSLASLRSMLQTGDMEDDEGSY